MNKTKRNNILFLVVIVLLILPQTRQPIQVLLHKGISLVNPVSIEEERVVLNNYDWRLKTEQELPYNFNQSKGKIVIVNFWATWCPPCVEEIPSLNRLKEKMQGKPFDLISINYAEDRQVILDFLKEVDVDYPVLMDLNGGFAKKWNVITYPSTFLIDTNGKIIYGVNSAIIWDEPEIIDIIKSLY